MKAVECFKWGLMSDSSRSMEDTGTESEVDYDGLVWEVSEEKNVKWDSDCS